MVGFPIPRCPQLLNCYANGTFFQEKPYIDSHSLYIIKLSHNNNLYRVGKHFGFLLIPLSLSPSLSVTHNSVPSLSLSLSHIHTNTLFSLSAAAFSGRS